MAPAPKKARKRKAVMTPSPSSSEEDDEQPVSTGRKSARAKKVSYAEEEMEE